jgi:hypothetical protein
VVVGVGVENKRVDRITHCPLSVPNGVKKRALGRFLRPGGGRESGPAINRLRRVFGGCVVA